MLRSRLLIVVFLAFFAPSTFAQDASTGAIRGSVSDATGGRIHSATIVVVNVATGMRFSATSDSEGHYAIDLMPPGDYSGRAEFMGMSVRY